MRRSQCWFGCLFLVAALFSAPPTPVVAQDVAAINQAKALSRAFRSASSRAKKSVVTIVAKTRSRRADQIRELMKDPRFQRLFPKGIPLLNNQDAKKPNEQERFNTQIGSGVIISREGEILTNNHVIAGADKVIVRLPSGEEFDVIGKKSDKLSDLAIIRIKTSRPIVPAKLGDSDKMDIGDWVLAIGSPFKLEATVSAGIISGKGRGISKIRRGRLMQTDAAINPGNSGGPLVNLDGEVVGINTAIATSSGGYQGIGFVIPINRAKWVARELAKHNRVRRAFLGISIEDLLPKVARQLGLAARSGVLVINVRADGPAEKAGLARNDVITTFAKSRVRTPGDLQDAVEQKTIGSTQRLLVMRNGRRLELQVKMTELLE